MTAFDFIAIGAFVMIALQLFGVVDIVGWLRSKFKK